MKTGFVLIVFLAGTLFSCNRGDHHEKQTLNADEEFQDHNDLSVYKIPYHDSLFIREVISSYPAIRKYKDQIFEFYNKRNYRCGWFNEFGLTEQAGKVVNLVSEYIQTGLIDTTFLMPEVVELYREVSDDGFTPEENETLLLKADILFTSQFLIFADKVWKGLEPYKAKQLEWFLPVAKSSFVDYLNNALTFDDGEVQGTEPVFKQFILLKEKLKLYSNINKLGGWQPIPVPEKALNPGDSSDLIPLLRSRLLVTTEFIIDSGGVVFDTSLAAAVMQSRNTFGLRDTPLIDKNYIRELNVPVEQRMKQMLLNLERWKWVPPSLAKDFIVVNIPEYMLHVFENNEKVKSMRVIVGKSATKTVIFNGNLTYVVFSPYWTIPRSIISNETLPSIKKNNNYLSQQNMEVVSNTSPPKVINANGINFEKYDGTNFPYTIRQKPGPNNSLGHVKFLFPNSYSIYLHDTPARNLFGQTGRMFSHGCIRIEEPQWLAEYLLRNESEWNSQTVYSAMHSGTERYVTLKEPIPVFITYFTSWVDTEGKLHFRNDVYGHDRKLEKVMLEN